MNGKHFRALNRFHLHSTCVSDFHVGYVIFNNTDGDVELKHKNGAAPFIVKGNTKVLCTKSEWDSIVNTYFLVSPENKGKISYSGVGEEEFSKLKASMRPTKLEGV